KDMHCPARSSYCCFIIKPFPWAMSATFPSPVVEQKNCLLYTLLSVSLCLNHRRKTSAHFIVFFLHIKKKDISDVLNKLGGQLAAWLW
ncbi:hypothetical protein ACQP3J_30995, partial [Escherichia coli]